MTYINWGDPACAEAWDVFMEQTENEGEVNPDWDNASDLRGGHWQDHGAQSGWDMALGSDHLANDHPADIADTIMHEAYHHLNVNDPDDYAEDFAFGCMTNMEEEK